MLEIPTNFMEINQVFYPLLDGWIPWNSPILDRKNPKSYEIPTLHGEMFLWNPIQMVRSLWNPMKSLWNPMKSYEIHHEKREKTHHPIVARHFFQTPPARRPEGHCRWPPWWSPDWSWCAAPEVKWWNLQWKTSINNLKKTSVKRGLLIGRWDSQKDISFRNRLTFFWACPNVETWLDTCDTTIFHTTTLPKWSGKFHHIALPCLGNDWIISYQAIGSGVRNGSWNPRPKKGKNSSPLK